jgi:hypothetical protein
MKDDTTNDYSTVNDDGVDYRTIASIMTANGYKMNHSSVRNYVLRMMKKFVEAYAAKHGLNLSEEKMNDIARSSMFHHGIADVLHMKDLLKEKNNDKR